GASVPVLPEHGLRSLPTSRVLGFVPEVVEGGEVARAEVDRTLDGQPLDGLEPDAELVGRGAQREFGVDVEMAGDVDHGEEEVAEVVARLLERLLVDRPPERITR